MNHLFKGQKTRNLKRVFNKSLKIHQRQSGQALIEYAVLLGFIAIALIGVVAITNQQVATNVNNIAGGVGSGGSDFTPLPANTFSSGGGGGITPVPNAPPNTIPPTPVPAGGSTNTPIPTPTVGTPPPAYVFGGASGAAVRYRVDTNGWVNKSDGFCQAGTAAMSGQQGLINITLAGQGGDVVCFRVDTFIGALAQGSTFAETFSIFNQTGGKGSPGNVQLSLNKPIPTNNYVADNETVNATYTGLPSGSSQIVPVYILIKLPADVCSNGTQTLRFKGQSSAQSHGLKIDTVCGVPPTPTPIITNGVQGS